MTVSEATNSVARAALVALMVLGGLALWIGVPAGVLWGLGEIVETKTQHLLLGIVAVPVVMTLCCFALVWLNRAYLELEGATREPGERLSGGPLEQIVAACAALAIVAFIAWMVAGTEGVAPLW